MIGLHTKKYKTLNTYYLKSYHFKFIFFQVKTDSHVFTPAIAHNAEMNPPAGPFRKAPFHANMHVLKTKI